MISTIVQATLYVKIIVDDNDVYNLLEEVELEKTRLGVSELPVSHDWYAIETREDAVKQLAFEEYLQGNYDVKDHEFTVKS